MSRTKTAIFFFFIFAFIFLNASAQEFLKTPEPINLKDGSVFVFLGDSITHQSLYTQYVENYYYTRYPDKVIHFRNAGVSGDVAADALIRFGGDVEELKPDYVSVLLGMNDASYQKLVPRIFNIYKKDMRILLKKIKSLQSVPILMAPTMFDLRQARLGKGWVKDSENVHYNANLAYYGAWLLQMANREGLHFVDMFQLLNNLTREGRKVDEKFTLIEDTVHPGANGQLVMAVAMLQDLGASDTVSEIHLDCNEGVLSRVQIRGGRLGGIKSEELSFMFRAESLPWVVPTEAREGFKLSEAGPAMSKEILTVTGLKKGNYSLQIDGKEVGKYSHREFSRGIHLEENSNTPQYQQAAKIARLNKEKNMKYVKPLRDSWWRLKQVRQYEEKPTDEGLRRLGELQISDMGRFKQNFRKVNKSFHQGIADAEKEIYSMNKPKKLEYRIVRIGKEIEN